jgi:hypothetical protein
MPHLEKYKILLKFVDGETQSILGLIKPCLERAAAGRSWAEKKAKRKEREKGEGILDSTCAKLAFNCKETFPPAYIHRKPV